VKPVPCRQVPLSLQARCWLRIRAVAAGAFLWLATASVNAAYRVELIAPDSLKEMLTEHLDLFRFRKREDINPDQLQYMVETAPNDVAQLVATDGYFTPKTDVRVERVGNETVVHLQLESGKRTVVSTAQIEVKVEARDKSTSQAEWVRQGWRLPVGAPFRQEDWATAKLHGLQILQQQRYPAAQIADSTARIYADMYEAELDVHYDSGPLFTLGEPVISGTSRYPEQIVRNVSPLHAGEEYSAERLLEYQQQILRLPYFSNAVIEVDTDPAQAERTPVKVRVTEFPVQRLRTGVGFSTDTGARLDGRYSHNDIFNRAWVLDTQLRLEQRLQSGTLDLAMPPDHSGFINSTHATFERSTLEGVELRSRRTGVRRAYTSARRDSAYLLEYYRDNLKQIDGALPPPDILVEPGAHQALMAGIEQTWRKVDDPVFPRNGRIYSVQAGVALQGLLTDQTFVRLYGQVHQFVPIGQRDLVILRGELGAVITKGGNSSVPASLLFRVGGTDSVRGYGFQSIGNKRDNVVYPARFMTTGSVEYQHWWTEKWGSAVFYDLGLASDTWSGKAFVHGLGIGARWRSPVGRVQLDLAYGFQDAKLQPHLSLGVAF